MMASRLQPPKQVRLCAIAPALVLSLLLPGPAAGVTQRYCPTKPHPGRPDGGVGRRGPQMCRVDVAPISKVKGWEQRGEGSAGMESALNSAPQAPIDPTGVNHDDARSEKLWMTPREATVT